MEFSNYLIIIIFIILLVILFWLIIIFSKIIKKYFLKWMNLQSQEQKQSQFDN